MIEMKCPEQTRGVTSYRKYVTGRAEGIEVFVIDGVEYIKTSLNRADIVVVFTGLGVRQGLERLDGTTKARAILCAKHRAYTAQRKPRSNCPTCWEAYNDRSGTVRRDTVAGNDSGGDSVPTQSASSGALEPSAAEQDAVSA